MCGTSTFAEIVTVDRVDVPGVYQHEEVSRVGEVEELARLPGVRGRLHIADRRPVNGRVDQLQVYLEPDRLQGTGVVLRLRALGRSGEPEDRDGRPTRWASASNASPLATLGDG